MDVTLDDVPQDCMGCVEKLRGEVGDEVLADLYIMVDKIEDPMALVRVLNAATVIGFRRIFIKDKESGEIKEVLR